MGELEALQFWFSRLVYMDGDCNVDMNECLDVGGTCVVDAKVMDAVESGSMVQMPTETQLDLTTDVLQDVQHDDHIPTPRERCRLPFDQAPSSGSHAWNPW